MLRTLFVSSVARGRRVGAVHFHRKNPPAGRNARGAADADALDVALTS
jgi:hypothetical protein